MHSTAYRLVPLLLIALAGCDAATHATGRVRDTQGKPLQGVVIELARDGSTERTRSNAVGHYSLTQIHGVGKAPADLTYCKMGYRLARRWFDDSRSIPRHLDVTMRAIDSTDTKARAQQATAPCDTPAVAGRAAKPNGH